MTLVEARDRGWYLRQFCFYGILVVQLFAVLAFGAVEYWSLGVMQFAALLFLVVWVISVQMGGAMRLRRNPLYLPMLAYGAWVCLQYATGKTAYGPLTRQGLLILITYFLFYFILVNTIDFREQKMTLAIVLMTFGTAVAIFALAQDFTDSTRIYWWRETTQGGWIYGPYVNHNHYAGFINMLVLMPLALVLGRMVRRDKLFIMLFLTTVMFVSVVFSASRGGLISFVAELGFLGLLFTVRRQGKQALLVAGVALVLAAVTAAAGTVVLKERFGVDIRTMAQGRVMVWQESVSAIRDHFWTGTGFATFGVVYPRYRTTPSHLFWSEAHNDYLQLFFETGVIGFALMIWFLVNLGRHVIPRLLHDHHPEFGLLLGATLGIFGILTHSLVDFNMQIPANAMLFFVLCALATL